MKKIIEELKNYIEIVKSAFTNEFKGQKNVYKPDELTFIRAMVGTTFLLIILVIIVASHYINMIFF